MVITDLDGTLLNNAQTVSTADYRTLLKLREQNILRVIATGRNLYSLRRVLPDDFPIDYVIFSCGSGILKWDTKEILRSHQIKAENVISISDFLIENDFDFTIHEPIPENHYFVFHSTGKNNPDFSRRIKLYEKFSKPISFSPHNFGEASQVIAITPHNLSLYHNLKDQFAEFKIIRTTSPLDGESLWIEFFPERVSKGHAAEWLCKQLAVKRHKTIGIGNDYNDLDLLEWTKKSFAVENAPQELKKMFYQTATNQNSGFSKALKSLGL